MLRPTSPSITVTAMKTSATVEIGGGHGPRRVAGPRAIRGSGAHRLMIAIRAAVYASLIRLTTPIEMSNRNPPFG